MPLMNKSHYILAIETSTEICSVCLSKKGEVILLKETSGVNQHSTLVSVYIDEIAKQTDISLNQLDAIAVSMGPGSYTGLRIGVSTAKGLCYALDKPLIAISTLEAMALKAIKHLTEDDPLTDALFCPMIDARRMEVYCAIFNQALKIEIPVTAEVIDNNSFLNYSNLFYFGNGAAKCRELLDPNPRLHFIDRIYPSAIEIAELALAKLQSGQFENTAYFEPFYLKEFVAGLPKVKGLL
jgi:tRNA threonylcarbamoyladenosine biosynthesis protein TsaB